MVSFWKRKFIWDIAMAFLIVILPFGLYLHLLFDDETATINIFGLVYKHHYDGSGAFVWHFLSMLIPIFLMLIWYFNFNYWLRYFILVPILLFEFRLIYNTLAYPAVIENNIIFITLFSLFLTIDVLLLFDRIVTNKKNKESIGFNMVGILKKGLKYKTNRFEAHINDIKSLQNHNQIKELFYIKDSLNKLIKNSITSKKNILKGKTKLDITLIALFLTLPLIFLSYYMIPEDVQSYDNNWLQIGNYGFSNMKTFIWYLSLKLCILIPLCVWFVLINDWWKYAILSPIVVFSFQLWEAVQNTKITDEVSYSKAAPWVLIILTFLLLVSNKVKHQSKILDIHEEISKDVEELLLKLDNTSGMHKSQEILEYLKKKDNKEENEKQRISSLIKIREELLMRLKTKT